jgi:hypothetical protein
MPYFGRLAGFAAAALTSAALYGCYAPPPAYPTLAAAPATAPPGPAAAYLPPTYPPAAYPPALPPLATSAPIPLTPEYLPQSGSTAPAAELPSGAGTTLAIAPYAPPPARIETPPPAPSLLAVWVSGHWSWAGTQYEWIEGHYAQRPMPSATWVSGYWRQDPNGWTWLGGHWT